MSELGPSIPAAVSLLGQRIDRYLIEAELGTGGFGAVYRARHTILGSEVALKVLWPNHARAPDTVERFLREARAAASLGHAHIIRVFDAGTSADGWPFLAMEILHGQDLDQLLQARGALDVDTTIEIGAQVLDALGAAHQHNIIHRDLKPANVFLVQGPDGRPFAKLLDFGISKIIGEGGTLTQTGTMLGTPHYMAPEQLESSRLLDGRANLFAVGVMLYQMVTGRLPLEGEGYGVLLRRIQGETGPPVNQLAPWVPAALAQVIERAMAFDAPNRFPNAGAMADALLTAGDSFGGSHTAMGGPPSFATASARAAMNIVTAPPVVAKLSIPVTHPPRGNAGTELLPVSDPSTGPVQPHPWLVGRAPTPAPSMAMHPAPIALAPASTSPVLWIGLGGLAILIALCLGAGVVLGVRAIERPAREPLPQPVVRQDPTPVLRPDPRPLPVRNLPMPGVQLPAPRPVEPVALPAPIPPALPSGEGVTYRIVSYVGAGPRPAILAVFERDRPIVAVCGRRGSPDDVTIDFIATSGGAITISNPSSHGVQTNSDVADCVAGAIPGGGPAAFGPMQTALVTVEVHVPAR